METTFKPSLWRSPFFSDRVMPEKINCDQV